MADGLSPHDFSSMSTSYPIVKHIALDVNDVIALLFLKESSHSESGCLKGTEGVSSLGAILLWSPRDALRPSQRAIQVEKFALTRAIGFHDPDSPLVASFRDKSNVAPVG